MKAKTGRETAAVQKKKVEPQKAKVIKLRLPRNYTWNGNGYDIR